MGMQCLICNNSRRLEIDRLLASGRSKASIGREFGVPIYSLQNHATNHLSRQLSQAIQTRTALESNNLLGGIEDLLSHTKEILDVAERKKRYGLALKSIREARGVYELLSKIAFSLHQARAAELQNNQDRWELEQEREQEEQIKILTNAELEMLVKLQKKVQAQDASMIIIPDKPGEFDFLPKPKSYDIDFESFEDDDEEQPEPKIRRTRRNSKYRITNLLPEPIPGE